MPPSRSPYRDGQDAVGLRARELAARLCEVEKHLTLHGAACPPSLRSAFEELRVGATEGASAEEVVQAERAHAILETELDELLGLAAEVNRAVLPVLPPASVLGRWAGMGLVATLFVVGGMFQIGVGDYLSRKMGPPKMPLHASMPCDRFAFEALTAARGGDPPEHGQWRSSDVSLRETASPRADAPARPRPAAIGWTASLGQSEKP